MSARQLVTGAAGLIGFELVRQFAEAGDEVVAVDSGQKGPLADLHELARASNGRVSVVTADLARDASAWPSALAGRFDGVYHLAAIVGVQYVCDHPWDTLAINLRSTLSVFERCREWRPAVAFFASSSENYAGGVEGGYVPVPTPERIDLSIKDVAHPRFSYAASKIAGESALFAAAREFDFAPLVGRFHNVYGPRMPATHVIPELLRRVRDGQDPLVVYGPEQTRSFLYVEDAARAVRIAARAAVAGDSGVVNIGWGQETRIDALARLVLEVAGKGSRIESRPAPSGSVARRVPDAKRIAGMGFQPKWSLTDGLRACWRALERTPA